MTVEKRLVSSELKRKLDESDTYFDLELYRTIRKILMGQVYLTKSELDQIGEAVDKSIRALEPIDRETHSAHKWLAAMESPMAVGNFEVRVEGRVFYVERNVLAATSSVFAACFELSPKSTKDGSDKFAHIDNFSAEVVEQFLLYCYTGMASRLPDIAADLVSMAQQYQVQDLCDKCEIYLIQDAIRFHRKNDFTGLFELAQMAEDYPLRMLLVTFHCIICERFKWEGIRQQDIWIQFFEKRPTFNTERYRALYTLAQDTVSSSQLSSLVGTNLSTKLTNLIPPRKMTSAYRIFVNEERQRLRRGKLAISGPELSTEISRRWIIADSLTRTRYEKLAADDRKRYLGERKVYDSEVKRTVELKFQHCKRIRQRSKSPAGDADTDET